MVDPILHPNDNVEDTRISQGKPVEKIITAEVSLSHIDDAREKVDVIPESSHPGNVASAEPVKKRVGYIPQRPFVSVAITGKSPWNGL
jgi:hypothetical protein